MDNGELKIIGVDYAKTIIIEFYQSEMLESKCIVVADEIWQPFVRAFEDLGYKVEERRLPYPIAPVDNYEYTHTVLDSVFTVQGMKRDPAMNPLWAIERLVSEYAKLK